MTTRHARLDTTLAALGILLPVTVLLTVAGYSRQRARTAWRDDAGFSGTVETAIWAAIALVVTLSVGTVIVFALRNRARTVGNDIENQPLP